MARGDHKRIASLECADQAEVRVEGTGSSRRLLAKLECVYPRKEWSLLWKDQALRISADGKVDLSFPLREESGLAELIAVSPQGKIEKERIRLEFPGFVRLSKRAGETMSTRKNFFTAGLDTTWIVYRETRIPDLSELVLTGRFSYNRLLFPNWDAGASIYATLLPLTKSGEKAARFLGANLRFGYRFPFVSEPWQVSLLAGYYYTTMWPFSSSFGFRHMQGPQLYPTVQRVIGGGAVSAYFKFSPVASGASFLNAFNHELAIGGGYTRFLGNGHPLTFSINLAALQLRIQGVEIRSNSYSVGVGYGF